MNPQVNTLPKYFLMAASFEIIWIKTIGKNQTHFAQINFVAHDRYLAHRQLSFAHIFFMYLIDSLTLFFLSRILVVSPYILVSF